MPHLLKNGMIRLMTLLSVLALSAGAIAQTVLARGDVVQLTCVEEPTLNKEYTITDTGLILLQYIGAVEVAGLTEKAAAERISTAFTTQQILRTATITLKLKRHQYQPITYGGALKKAGQMPWREGLKLSDVLRVAEPTETAELAQIRISRADGNVASANAAKTPPDDPILEPGDRVFVPLRVGGNEIIVLGAVIKPGLVPFTSGMTVSEAIRAAGGLRVDGDDTRIAVTFRAGGSSVANLTVPGSDVALAPGDQLTVPIRSATDHVYIRGAVSRPGMVPYSPGLTVGAVVSSATPVEGARLDKVKIVRKGPDGKTKTTTVNLAKVSQGEAQDQPLLPGDVVNVPYPGKSFGMREKLQLVSLALFIYFLLK